MMCYDYYFLPSHLIEHQYQVYSDLNLRCEVKMVDDDKMLGLQLMFP